MMRMVMIGVWSYLNNGKGECYAAQRNIAKKIGCSQDTVKRLLPKLVKDGYLEENGSRSVRGGNTLVYVLSERWSFTNRTKANDTAWKANDAYAQKGGKQLKKQLKASKKNNNISPDGERIQPSENVLGIKDRVALVAQRPEGMSKTQWELAVDEYIERGKRASSSEVGYIKRIAEDCKVLEDPWDIANAISNSYKK